MNIFRLALVNLKRYLKNPVIIVMTVLLPLVVVISMNMGGFSEDKAKVGMDIQDAGSYGEELKDKLSENFKIEIVSRGEDGKYKGLSEGEYGALLVIPKNFTELIKLGKKPDLNMFYQQDEGTKTVVGNFANEFIVNKIKDNLNPEVKDKKIQTVVKTRDKGDWDTVVLTMLCYFLFIGGSILLEDVIKIKKEKILRRSITTGNKDYEILGGMFLAMVLLQTLASSSVYLIFNAIYKLDSIPAINAVLAIGVSSILSTAMIVFIVRWVKNQMMASLGMVLISLVSFVLGMVSTNLAPFSGVPTVLTNISKMLPFHWVINLVKGNDIILSLILCLVMAVVFFLCGSLKLRNFAKE